MGFLRGGFKKFWKNFENFVLYSYDTSNKRLFGLIAGRQD